MKKHLVLSLMAVMCAQAWAAGQPAQTADNGWQPAVTLTDPPPQQAAPASPTAAATPHAPEATEQAAQDTAPQQSPAHTPPAPSGAGQDALPLPSPLYNAVESQVMPLTPDELRKLKGMEQDKQKALTAPAMTIVPRISARTVELSPGASLPLVRTAVNNASNVTFTDATGAPWPVSNVVSAAPDDFGVYSMKDGPIVTVQARRAYAAGNITVYLKNLPVPVVMTVSSGETDTNSRVWTIDSRLDLRIPQRGPDARPMAAPASRIGLYDNTLQAFLDGTPPPEARRLKISGGVPDTSVWQLGDDLFIRSRAEVMDEFEQTLSSADGMHLWKLPVSPYVTFSVMGRSVPLNITLE